MPEHKPSLAYRCIRGLVKAFYPKLTVIGAENLPREAALIVGNHSQLHGPIAAELYFPGDRYTWCAGEMMHAKEVPAYAFRDFWSQKPRWTLPFYRVLSYLITPFSVCVFNNARTIPVYHDSRVLGTFKKTVATLAQGSSVVVFPEKDAPHNHILCAFQDKFIDIARLYHKKTGKCLQFVPMYLAPNLRQLHLGKPLVYDPEEPMDTQRPRLCAQLQDAITSLALALPEHTVVPYRNIPKKLYPKNTQGGRP